MKLPSAIFVCGSLDPLLDDTIFMASKWQISGAETIAKIYPGAPHGFTFFPSESCEETVRALNDIKQYVNERI